MYGSRVFWDLLRQEMELNFCDAVATVTGQVRTPPIFSVTAVTPKTLHAQPATFTPL
jgi:hypothetical protein